MKRILAILLAMLLLLGATACGKSEPPVEDGTENESQSEQENETGAKETEEFVPLDVDPYDYMANDLSGFIKVGEYKGITVTLPSHTVTDEDFEDEIQALLESRAEYEKITDRAVVEGDTVLADYAGSKDGVLFDGGSAQDQEIVASASSGYIPGFAEALIGHTPGEVFSAEITFPETYHETTLAGQTVTFTYTLKAILADNLITPELTDEFVKEEFGYNNVGEFRIAYRSSVEKARKYDAENQMYGELWQQLTDGAVVLAYPGQEVDRIYSETRVMYEYYAAYYGTDYETFLSTYMGMTNEDLYEESRKYVKEDLVMYALVKELDISVSDEEYTAGLAFFADYYGATTEELLEYYGEDTIRATLLWEKLMKTVADLGTIKNG